MTKKFIIPILFMMFTQNAKTENIYKNPLKRQIFYCPTREKYTNKSNIKNTKKNKSCIFCKLWAKNNDKENLIVARFEHNSIFLNRYPYNKGHLLIIPNKHVKNLDKLNIKEKLELIQIISKVPKILKDTLGADGANIGINLGKIGGASKPDHVHVHIIPRYTPTHPNYTSLGFIQTAGETKLIGWNLETLYDILKPEFDKLKSLLKNF